MTLSVGSRNSFSKSVTSQPECDPRHYPAQRQTNEADRRLSGVKRSGHGGGHREPIEDEPGGVIDQALALQQYSDARRQGEALQNGLGGNRVGRRNNRAERKACGPGKRRLDPMRHNADGQGRERDRADRQLKNNPQIGAKVPPDGKIGAGEQQRWQKQH